jgi:hypothetical protein
LGWDSVVSITAYYGMDSSGDLIQVGVRFSAFIQTGYEAHPASYAMVTSSLFRE